LIVPTVFILFRHPELVPVLQRHYPGGTVREHLDNEKRLAFISYTLVPQDHVFPLRAVPVNTAGLGWGLMGGAAALWAHALYHKWQHRY